MKVRKFDPIFFDSTEGRNIIVTLLTPYKASIESMFSQTLETVVRDKVLWTKMCMRTYQLPIDVYRILSNIAEFGRDQFREKIISILESNAIDFDRSKSCQYLVAEMLLHCPDGISVLYSQQLAYNRRRFFKFSITDDFPKKYSMLEFSRIIECCAIKISDRRTALGESVKVYSDDLKSEDCWQFNVKWCDKISSANTYDRTKKTDDIIVLPLMEQSLVRYYLSSRDIEINVETISQAREFVNMIGEIIWGDGNSHFQEQVMFTLEPLKNFGSEIFQISHPLVKKIILNMVEFYNAKNEFPIRYGKNSKLVNATAGLKLIGDNDQIKSAYFTVFLKSSVLIKFGITPPSKLDLAAAHRPFIYDLIDEMGLMDVTRSVLRSSICEAIENFWESELSRQELLFSGIDIMSAGWKNFFGKSNNSAHYYFCDQCNSRHVLIPAGEEYLAIDENQQCDVEYRISDDDLELFIFNQQTFLKSLQRAILNTDIPKILEIVPFKCWQLGKFIDEHKLYFVRGSTQQDLDDAIFRTLAIAETTEPSDFVILTTREQIVNISTKTMVEARNGHVIFLENLLGIDRNGCIRMLKKLHDVLPDLVKKSSANDRHNIISESLSGFITLDDEYKKQFPKSKPPYPSEVLQKKFKRKMTEPDIAKSCGCTDRKIRSVISRLP